MCLQSESAELIRSCYGNQSLFVLKKVVLCKTASKGLPQRKPSKQNEDSATPIHSLQHVLHSKSQSRQLTLHCFDRGLCAQLASLFSSFVLAKVGSEGILDKNVCFSALLDRN